MGILNGVGEELPDEVPVGLTYDHTGRLAGWDTPGADRPRGAAGYVATLYTEWMYGTEACVSRATRESSNFNTLQKSVPTVLYMDVGLWGDNIKGPRQRNFGVVWRDWAVLCNFGPQVGRPLSNIDGSNSTPIDEVLKALDGAPHPVHVIHKLRMEGRQCPDPNKVYVFLPDLHLPIAIEGRKPKLEKRLDYVGSGGGEYEPPVVSGSVGGGYHQPPVSWKEAAGNDPKELPDLLKPMGRHFWSTTSPRGGTALDAHDGNQIEEWYKLYAEADVFRNAAPDLEVFLRRLESAPDPSNIVLIQMGDMYDLWIGLERQFKDTSNVPRGVVRPHASRVEFLSKEAGEEFVTHWIHQVHLNFPKLAAKTANLEIGDDVWLFGNHDDYLGVFSPEEAEGDHPRHADFREDAIFASHGHYWDEQNRDGNPDGHTATQDVFAHSSIRSWDPNRRDYYLTAAAIEYAQQPDFGVFVMAHTHSPYLTRVRVKVQQKAPPQREKPMP